MSPLSAPIRLAVPMLRAALAILALVGQIALGSLVLPDQADARPLVALRAAMVLCGSGPAAHTPPSHQHRRHPSQDACCLLEAALALPAVILPAVIPIPPPLLSTGGRLAMLPPARAPPAPPLRSPRARGPPIPA